ncbi:MAG: DUF748 domain-containing protein [Candidatus Binataceae bacterium]
MHFLRSRLARNIGIGVLAAFVLFTLLGFFAVPPLVGRYVTGTLAASIKRPIKVGPIHFNPYTLNLNLDKIDISQRVKPRPFVQIARLHVQASWWSLFKLAPIISALEIDQPVIHVIRTGDEQFNFSDLLQSSPSKPKSGPTHFSVSNLRLKNGLIDFNDLVLHQHHTINDLQIGVPFVANLPAYVNVYVQPYLEMVIDGGTPLRITGRALPFSSPPESIVDLHLEHLELPRYVAYLPKQIPLKIPKGTLSCRLRVHFVNSRTAPVIRVAGMVAFDNLDVRNEASAPLFSLVHAQAGLSDVEPMRDFASFNSIQVTGLITYLLLNRDGTTNLSKLTSQPTQPPPTPVKNTQGAPADVSVKSFDLSQSVISVTDNRGAQPTTLSLAAIHFALQNFATRGTTPANFNASANLGSGTIEADGTLNYPRSRMTSTLTMDQIALPPLQPLVHLAAPARLATGQLNLHAKMTANYGSPFNLHVEPADLSIENVALAAPNGGEEPVQWKQLSVSVAQFDLASHQANVTKVQLSQLHLLVHREHDGTINLLSLMGAAAPPPATQAATTPATQGVSGTAQKTPAPASATTPGPAMHPERVALTQATQAIKHAAPVAPVKGSAGTPSTPPTPASVKSSPWKYQIASFNAQDTTVHVVDDSASKRVDLTVAPLNVELKGISNNLAKPIAIDLSGTINHGNFKVIGTAAPQPLQANLHVNTQRLNLAALSPYLTGQINASIAEAELNMNGATKLSRTNNHLQVHYTGDATLANLRVLDKVTSRPFARWRSFRASRINASYGGARPRVDIGELALTDLRAGIILNSDGRLNLQDIEGKPGSAAAQPPRSQLSSSSYAAAEARSAFSAPAIGIGGFVMHNGGIGYTDNFIKPNYSARLTDINGKIGAFSTNSRRPANVSLRGKVNNSAPVAVNGTVDPLAPMAYVNLAAKADGVELTRLSTYSAKYTGYPIIKGTLTVNVHYLLDQKHLSAQNHIFINQLTFGPKVESPNAINLPIRLAVALLKNSQGQINLEVPVSGSLSDPDFSLGGVILTALKNIIVKAAAAPFKLLASAFGNKQKQLNHIDFTAGYATLTADARGKLDTLAKALSARHGLSLTIIGQVDPVADTDGLRHGKLEREVKAQKIKALETNGEHVNPNEVHVSKEEYKKYLTRAYKAAKFSKPRNFIGLEKSLPVDQMSMLMLAHITVDEQDLHRLAEKRADAVRAYLAAQQIDPARLFVQAPKLEVKETAPRVELGLQ